MDRHCSHVLQLHVATLRHLDAELRHHVVEGLYRERRLGGLVAAAIKADHQAVTDQLVRTHALDAGQVFQALGLHQRRHQHGRDHH